MKMVLMGHATKQQAKKINHNETSCVLNCSRKGTLVGPIASCFEHIFLSVNTIPYVCH